MSPRRFTAPCQGIVCLLLDLAHFQDHLGSRLSGNDVSERTNVVNAPLDDNRDAIGDALDVTENVTREEDRFPLCFEVQNNVGQIFLNAFDSREFVLNTIDTDSGNCSSLNGGEQYSSKQVSERYSIASLQRLYDETAKIGRKVCFVEFNLFWHQ